MYFQNIINQDLADKIIDFLNNQEWKGVSISKTGRKVQQYGFEYDYISRKDTEYKKITDIPDILLDLKQTIEHLITCDLNQCIVNKYEPGQGISAHVDKETFGPIIICFTLCSGTIITFTKTVDRDKKMVIEKYVEPNSVYFMTEDSRYEWKHEIKPRLADNGIKRETRISITFRNVSEI